MSFFLKASGLILGILLNVTPTLAQTEVSKGRKGAIIEDQVVAGGPKDFMEVRHLVLRGSNEEIGRALATIAQDQFGVKPQASTEHFAYAGPAKVHREKFPDPFRPNARCG
jgi:hypothetical protein